MPIVLNFNIQRDASVCRQHEKRREGERKQGGRKREGERETDMELGAGSKAPERRWRRRWCLKAR